MLSIHWSTSDVQKEDEAKFKAGTRGRFFYWLQTAKQIVLTGFSKMKVGWAIDILRPETRMTLRAKRLGLLAGW